MLIAAPLPEWNSAPPQEPVYLDRRNRFERANNIKQCKAGACPSRFRCSGRRRRGGACPARMAYKRQHPVQMVRHDHKLVHHQPREPLYQRNPFGTNNLARWAQDSLFSARNSGTDGTFLILFEKARLNHNNWRFSEWGNFPSVPSFCPQFPPVSHSFPVLD
jgi:hypothetical protein